MASLTQHAARLLHRARPEAIPTSHRAKRRLRAPGSRAAAGIGLALVSSLAAADLLLGGPAATADTQSVAVADALGVAGARTPVSRDAEQLGDLVASRSEREADQATAAASQAQAEQAAADAKAAAEAQAAAEAAAAEAAAARAAAAAAAAAAPAPAATSAAAAGTSATAVAKISNSSGPVRPQTQAAANAVVSNVPGAAAITIGGTRPSAADPGGHPSGLALDYMVGANVDLGNAIVEYHKANWDALGVEYIIYRQRMLTSPGGAWQPMEDRGSPTANHMDHPHVNYRG